MPTFQRFEEIEAWQLARALTREIYRVSKLEPLSRDYTLRDQLRRASISIMSNIAEGFERGGTGEFIQFLSIAKGSAGEVSSHLYVALDQNYLDRPGFDALETQATQIRKLLAGLINYLRKAGIKGTKYLVREEIGDYLAATSNPKLETSNRRL